MPPSAGVYSTVVRVDLRGKSSKKALATAGHRTLNVGERVGGRQQGSAGSGHHGLSDPALPPLAGCTRRRPARRKGGPAARRLMYLAGGPGNLRRNGASRNGSAAPHRGWRVEGAA